MINKAFDNASIFVTTYIIVMLPTYLLPYLRTSTFALYRSEDAGADVFNFAFLIYLASMIVLCWICWVRGAIVGKKWLIVLPMIAFAFEFISKLSVIPYVPSMYHALAIIVGAVSANVLVSKSLTS